MNYTDVFGGDTLPPSEFGYQALTFAASITLFWPYNYSGTGTTTSKIMEATASAGSLYVQLPAADQVSTGEDLLIRNVGANTFDVRDAGGSVITSVVAGVSKYLYLTSNTTAAGVWHVFTFGTGTSAADASALAGYGLKVTGATLSQSHAVTSSSASAITIDSTYRAKVLNLTGGTTTLSLGAASTLGDDFFVMLRNSGTGQATIDPNASELVDGNTTLTMNPGESLVLVCTGTAWVSVGYGRSAHSAVSQLLVDVTAGGTFTLSTTEASNQMLRIIGTPSATTTIVVPNTVFIYQLQNESTQSVLVKTLAGAGVTVASGYNVAAKCDGTDVVNALDITVTGNTPDYIIQSYGVI